LEEDVSMKKRFRGLLSLVLAVAMTVGLLPLSALPARAEGEDADPLGLHGQTFAIVNPNDKAAMTAEFAGGNNAEALKNLPLDRVSLNGGRYSVLCKSQGDAARICVWSFTYEGGQYFIHTEAESGPKYLKFIPAQGANPGVGRFELVSERADASPITVVEKNGLYRLSAPVQYEGYEGIDYDVAISSDAGSSIFGGWNGDINNEDACKYILQALCAEADITEPSSPSPSGGTQVTGVSPLGTTIGIFDYWVTNPTEADGADGDGAIKLSAGNYINDGINGKGQLKFSVEGPWLPNGKNINRWTDRDGDLRTGIVNPRLGADGYPVLAAGEDTGLAAPDDKTREASLGYLFDGQDIEGAKAAYPDVKGLFRVDKDGYYYFDSANTSAQLVTEGEEKGSFRLFDMATEGSSTGFFPFNTAIPDHNGYQGTDSANPYPNTGKVNSLNHFFGVHMTTQFIQSAGGLTDEGQHVTYDFTGDDDVWIYLDGVLVGDVGGIHNAANVNIDFATGDITYKVTDTHNESNPILEDYSQANSTIFEQYRKAVGEGNISYYTARFDEDGSYSKTGKADSEAAAQLAEVSVGNNVYIFKKSGGKWIFADGTYHTLDFFYLERGGGLSNMRLKFNLEEIPPTYVEKVDQDGVPIAGVSFELYVLPKNTPPDIPAAQDGLAVPAGGQRVAIGTTDGEGRLLLTYSDDMGAKAGKVLSLADLYNSYKDELWDEVTSSGGLTYRDVLMLDLREKKSDAMVGYRDLTNISLRLEKINGTYIMRSNDRWNNGVYATPSVTISASKNITLFEKGDEGQSVKKDLSALEEGKVGLFAVVLGWIKKTPPQSEDDLKELSNWGLVQGSPQTGWTIKALDGSEEYTTALGRVIGDYAKANNGSVEGCAYPFSLAASGSYNTAIQNLPGEIDSYYFMIADQNGNLPRDETDPAEPDRDALARIRFTTAFYYSDAYGWENMNGKQTFRVNHRESEFERDFGATVNVPNIQDRLTVQRLDAVGNTVEGATFKLYDFKPVIGDVDPATGEVTVTNPGGGSAQEVDAAVTRKLEKGVPYTNYYGEKETAVINAEGSAVLDNHEGGLADGVYYLVEVKAPPGFERNEEIVKVIVDERGVHAYAGKAGSRGLDPNKGIAYGDGDGVSVLVGVGSLVNTMAHFGSTGDVDTTLTDIYVLRARAKTEDGSADADENADELKNWEEVKADNLRRKWMVYSPDAALQYQYYQGTDPLGQENTETTRENPYGYLSSSGWNWNLVSQNYCGVYDTEAVRGDPDIEDNPAVQEETRTKTKLITKPGPSTADISDGFTSYGNKILSGVFTGTTVVRFASASYGSLCIAKKVALPAGVTAAPDTAFPFTLGFTFQAPEAKRDPAIVGDIDLAAPALAGDYPYTVTDQSGAELEAGTLKIGADGAIAGVTPANTPGAAAPGGGSTYVQGGKLYLKADETLTIRDLPVGMGYTVQEEAAGQYTTQAVAASTAPGNQPVVDNTTRTASGTISQAGQVDTVTYTNTYAGPPAQVKVEYYLVDGGTQRPVDDPTDNPYNPFPVPAGDTWRIGFAAPADGTAQQYTAQRTIGDGGTTYAYDPNGTEVVKTDGGAQADGVSSTNDAIFGEMGSDSITVRLYYAPDTGGDGVPDKYQMTVNYLSEDTGKGTVSKDREILTIYDVNDPAKYAVSGNAAAKGSTALAKEGYKFDKWTLKKGGAAEEDTGLPAETAPINLTGVTAGDEYTYTAYFQEKLTELAVVKTLAAIKGAVTDYDGTGPVPQAQVGDTITWQIVVTNKGETGRPELTLSDLTLTDEMQGAAGTAAVFWDPDGTGMVPYTAGTTFSLDPGDELTFTAQYVVQEGDAGKNLKNTAIVNGPGGEEGRDTPDPVPVEKRGLGVAKEVASITAADGTVRPVTGPAMAGDTVVWNITVTNTGNVPLNEINVADALASGLAIKPVAAGVTDGGNGSVIIPSLAAQSAFYLTASYVVQAEDTGIIENVVTAVCGGLTDTARSQVPVTDQEGPDPGPDANPALDVNKTLTAVNGAPYYGGTVREGDVLTYAIIVTNTGNVELAAVSLADQLPGGLYPIGAQGWELGPMGIGDRREVSFTAVVAPGTSGWPLTNTATATGTTAEGEPVTASDTETVQVEIPYIPPTPPVPPIDPEPDQPVTPPEDLNTEDHVAYIIGYPDGTVRPDGNITRAEVATIFFRLLTDEARETYWCQANGYTDVPAQRWYNNAVSTLSNMGIISGYPDGSFRPDAPITRAELTKIAVGFFQYADQHFRYQGDFSDVTGREWYAGFVAAASALGLIEGYPDGTFRPNEAITRAETCTIVNRTLGRKPHEDHLLPYEVMITWPDNRLDAWYYAQIQEATNSHDYLWISITENWEAVEAEEWTAKLEERDWAALEHMWSTAHSAPGGEVMG